MAMCPLEDPDPNGKDSVTYHWTKRRIDELMAEALENPGRYAIPGTGGTTGKDGEKSKKVQYLRRAKDAGFVTRVVLLTCSDDVALKRNARRPRQLPEEIVKSSIEAAAAAFEVAEQAVRHGAADRCERTQVWLARSQDEPDRAPQQCNKRKHREIHDTRIV